MANRRKEKKRQKGKETGSRKKQSKQNKFVKSGNWGTLCDRTLRGKNGRKKKKERGQSSIGKKAKDRGKSAPAECTKGRLENLPGLPYP